jgi:hypothetical protein
MGSQFCFGWHKYHRNKNRARVLMSATIKISQLPAATTIANTAIFPLVQNATTQKATLAQIASAIGGGTSGNAITQLIGDVTTGTGGGVQSSTIANSGVVAGSYINANITVNSKGLITSAANGIISSNPAILITNFTSSLPGAFTSPHSLGSLPRAVTFTMTNSAQLGQFWLNTANVALGFDSANVYGIASDANVAGQIIIFG